MCVPQRRITHSQDPFLKVQSNKGTDQVLGWGTHLLVEHLCGTFSDFEPQAVRGFTWKMSLGKLPTLAQTECMARTLWSLKGGSEVKDTGPVANSALHILTFFAKEPECLGPFLWYLF